jgi:integrase
MYRKALEDFVEWWRTVGKMPLDRTLVQTHLKYLLDAQYSSATVNQRLSAIRKAVSNAADKTLLDLAAAMEIIRIASLPRSSVSEAFSLSTADAERLINAPVLSTLKGVRDRALLALLVGCALRPSELVEIRAEDIQARTGQWVVENVVGLRGHSRTVAIPTWAKVAVDAWLEDGQVLSGPVFCAIDRLGKIANRSLSAQSVLPIVSAYGRGIGIDVRPHDLRRTCAQLCRLKGGELDQIQLLLGHASVQTTERYLGARRGVVSAPNRRLRLKWHSRKLAS